MKTTATIVLIFCLLSQGAVAADAGVRIALYADESASNCNLYDTGPGLHEVYVIFFGSSGISAAEFRLAPTYGAALTYIAETVMTDRSMTAGRADGGIAVALGGCESGSHLALLRVVYQGLGVSDVCSQLRIKRDPRSPHANGNKIFYVDCSINGLWADPGHLTINPDDDCECDSPGAGGPSPVASTTWGGIKALYVD
jgi:hypothetical protein